ncbi:MAG: hypothetical protein HY696_10605 [Deltaproteobacteria bacterium]|nr:hypothetical protein [Deltaproteobacteria bacterium]
MGMRVRQRGVAGDLVARQAALRARLAVVATHSATAQNPKAQQAAATITRIGETRVGPVGRLFGRPADFHLTRAEARLAALETSLGITPVEAVMAGALTAVTATEPQTPDLEPQLEPVNPFAAIAADTPLGRLCHQIAPWRDQNGAYLVKYVVYRDATGVEHYAVCPEDKHHPDYRQHMDLLPDGVDILAAGQLRLWPEGESVRVALDGNSSYLPTIDSGIIGFVFVRGLTVASDAGMYAALDFFQSHLGRHAIVQTMHSAWSSTERDDNLLAANAPLAVLRRELARQYNGLAKYVVYEAAGIRGHVLGDKGTRHLWRLPSGATAVVGAGFVRLLPPTSRTARPILVIDGSSGSFDSSLDEVVLREDEPGELTDCAVTLAATHGLRAVVAYWHDLIGHQAEVRAYRSVEHVSRITEDNRLL